ncbi:MAG: glycosyl transferase, partial [Polymorphobacter sp.]
AATLRPFVDFLYLQTPLQPLLFKGLVGLVPGWDFIVLRLANAACGLGTLALVWLTQRRLGVPPATAWVATLALAGCVSFIFAVSGARNDALPTLLLAAAAWLSVDARRAWHWAVIGALLGLAASAKISFALPGAALGLWLVVQAGRGQQDWRAPLACGVGAALGLVPSLLAWAAAPDAFLYGVLGFANEAGYDWYRQNGLAARLHFTAKLWQTPWYLAQGPALAALLLVGWRWRVMPARATAIAVLLAGGFIGALLPTPMWKQYFMPVLPPLFILTGVALAGMGRAHAGRARVLLLVLAVAASLGFAFAAGLEWRRYGQPAGLRVVAQAHWLGDTLRAAGHTPADGAVASFTPAMVIDSGFALDRRFATGVFVFRSGDLRTDDELARW